MPSICLFSGWTIIQGIVQPWPVLGPWNEWPVFTHAKLNGRYYIWQQWFSYGNLRSSMGTQAWCSIIQGFMFLFLFLILVKIVNKFSSHCLHCFCFLLLILHFIWDFPWCMFNSFHDCVVLMLSGYSPVYWWF